MAVPTEKFAAQAGSAIAIRTMCRRKQRMENPSFVAGRHSTGMGIGFVIPSVSEESPLAPRHPGFNRDFSLTLGMTTMQPYAAWLQASMASCSDG